MKNNCIIPVWKPAGWTPLKAVLEFKKNNQEFINRKISYAGRLDPMAEGILLFLADGENKKRREYEDLKKTYESEIILGIKTDSFDALGIIEKTRFESKLFKEQIKECLNTFIGKQKQFYPPYSSKAIEGKPLYWWARNKKLSEIKIPKREIEIYDISLESFDLIERKILVKKIIETIEIVEGEFRQK